MRMLLIAKFPNEKFNEAFRDGTVGQKIGRIMEEIKPDTAFFTAMDGMRTAVMTFDLKHESDIPRIAEPFFLTFDAQIELQPAMVAEDLQNAGMEAVGKKWSS